MYEKNRAVIICGLEACPFLLENKFRTNVKPLKGEKDGWPVPALILRWKIVCIGHVPVP